MASGGGSSSRRRLRVTSDSDEGGLEQATMGAPDRNAKRRKMEEDVVRDLTVSEAESVDSTKPTIMTTPGDGQELKVKTSRGITEITVMRGSVFKGVKQIVQNENYDALPMDVPTYASIEAPPSLLPPRKYCEITGFPAQYTDPRTKMNFCSPDAFRVARSLQEHQVQKFLALRNADMRLK